jgi:hypothetical protein
VSAAQAVREAGVEQETVFVIVGDHASSPSTPREPVHAALLAAGHAKLEAGKIVLSPDLRVSALGGSAAIYPREGAAPASRRLERDLRAELDRHENLVRADPAQRARIDGRLPGAAFALASAPGYMLIAVDAPVTVLPSGALNGMHGHRPTLPGMAGLHRGRAGHSPRARASVVRQIDVAPTLAVLMGLPLEQAVGLPIPGLLETKDTGLGNVLGQ